MDSTRQHSVERMFELLLEMKGRNADESQESNTTKESKL